MDGGGASECDGREWLHPIAGVVQSTTQFKCLSSCAVKTGGLYRPPAEELSVGGRVAQLAVGVRQCRQISELAKPLTPVLAIILIEQV